MVGTTINCPRDSQKLDLYINEEGMYQLLFSSEQLKAKDFRRHCCNVLFPHVRQQLTNKLKEEHQQAITDYQQEILRLNEEIDDLIANRHVAPLWMFRQKRIAGKGTHTKLFNVSTGNLKKISDGLNFVT